MRVGIINFKLYEYGGGLTYQLHLYRMLKEFNHTPFIMHPSRENKASRNLKKEGYFVIDKMDRKKLDPLDIILIANTTYKKGEIDILKMFVKKKVFLVIHDPSQDRASSTSEYALKFLLENSDKLKIDLNLIFIRDAVAKFYKEKYNIDGTVIKHPYGKTRITNKKKEDIVISTSRIDFDKNTHILIDSIDKIKANVKIYSGFINSIYEYHVLNGKHNWNRKNYYGSFSENEKSRIYGEAKVMVDMSSISNDGGGTQYTFLEAMENDVAIIGNESWDIKGGEMVVGKHYLTANENNLSEKVNLLLTDETKRKELNKNCKEILEAHSFKKINECYQALFNK